MTVKGTTLTMVHPHTSDQPDDFGDNGEDIVDLWYGTTEPLSRVRAGETLIFYDPVCLSLPPGGFSAGGFWVSKQSGCGQVDFTEMGMVATKSAAVLLSPATDQNSTLGRQADALFEATKARRRRSVRS